MAEHTLESTAGQVSLEGLHGTVDVPPHRAGFWAQWRAFVGPALLVSVGYMDPGNWGTDLAGGAQFKYALLWVVALSSVMAMVLQVTSARLGVVTGKDLAQCCRDWYPRWSRWPMWILAELAIGACDLAEVLGSAVALNLLFGIPLLWAVIVTACDVFLLLALQRVGMRAIEAVVLVLFFTQEGKPRDRLMTKPVAGQQAGLAAALAAEAERLARIVERRRARCRHRCAGAAGRGAAPGL